MSPADMNEKYEMMARQDRNASLVDVTVNGISIADLPVIPQPGQAQGTIGIALGYGREKAGSLSVKTGVIGKNIYPWVSVLNGTMAYSALSASVSAEKGTTEIAGTQIHHTLMGRNIVKETVLEDYKKDAMSGNHPEMLVTHSGKVNPKDIDLWDEHDKLGHRWGMTIDLNSCIGCGACVVG
jgi:molybdopterin-containing oxidoreductase family iron-sulfur binding subunit